MARSSKSNLSIAFVVDSVQRASCAKANEQLQEILADLSDLGLEGSISSVVVLANKQDMEDAMPLSELEAVLKINGLGQPPVSLLGVSAKTGQGVPAALNSLVRQQGVRRADTNQLVQADLGTAKAKFCVRQSVRHV